MDPTIFYAIPLAAAVVWLVASRKRLGAVNAGAWLLVLAAIATAGEDGALSVWYPIASPSLDPDGLAGVANEHARAHMLGAGVWTFLAAALVVVLARGPLRRGERWAWRTILAYAAIGVGADLVIYGALYTHGLPLPLPGWHGGFGWPPVAVALVAWCAGLWLTRPITDTRP